MNTTTFRFCDSMIHDFWRNGYAVFRRILPASLLRDLRREADKARALAHQLEYADDWLTAERGNQVNCAIYPDACLWYAPGTYSRFHDLPGEQQTFCYVTGKNPFDEMEASHAELERAILDDCHRFPNAVRLSLDPGDFCVYRSYGWHTGVYTPYHPRATIHDTVQCEPPVRR